MWFRVFVFLECDQALHSRRSFDPMNIYSYEVIPNIIQMSSRKLYTNDIYKHSLHKTTPDHPSVDLSILNLFYILISVW